MENYVNVETWTLRLGDMETWIYGDMVMETWAGDIETWTLRHSHGDMDMETWTRKRQKENGKRKLR